MCDQTERKGNVWLGNFQRSIWSLLCEVTDLSTFITVLQEAGLFLDRGQQIQIIDVGITAEFMEEIIRKATLFQVHHRLWTLILNLHFSF